METPENNFSHTWEQQHVHFGVDGNRSGKGLKQEPALHVVTEGDRSLIVTRGCHQKSEIFDITMLLKS